MRVNKRVVALRSGVAFASLPPSAPFPGCPTGRGRTGAGEPPGAAAAEPRAAPRLPRPPCPAAPPSLCPGLLRAPPRQCRRQAGGGRGRSRRRGRDAPGAPCPAPGGAGQRGSGASLRCRGNTRRRGARCGGDAVPLPSAPDPPCAAAPAPLLGMKPPAIKNAEVASLARLPA